MSTVPETLTRTVQLAQLRLEERSRDVHRDLTDATSLHNRVQALFPDNLGPQPRAATNTLFRVEREAAGPVLLIQSTLPINRNGLPAGYARDIAYRDLNPLLDWAAEGRVVRYRVDAHPSMSQSLPGQRGKRVPLRGEEALQWWERQAGKAGLDNQLALDIPQPDVRARRGSAKPVRYSVIRFEGVARVIDPIALRETITTGIGRGRAYGLGLLSIAPYRP
ncbi:type I-E CRISPR-associated protein Cas6/Cse3/CasE [Streptomyces sp. NPDC002602]|uniref:type I-E CRISPR-associated protein Cas6/Cse3/CasE n=1 Tax=Streptomyces sp. NPDC002602 TaxID=3364654 RepID=UPI0036910A20